MAATTTETIMDDLYAITWCGTITHTVVRRFQVLPEDFEDFSTFPLVCIETGPENSEALTNKESRTVFHPRIHVYCEDNDAETMETWRTSVRNAFYGSTTLLADAMSHEIDTIEPELSPNRKLQHLIFTTSIEFDNTH